MFSFGAKSLRSLSKVSFEPCPKRGAFSWQSQRINLSDGQSQIRKVFRIIIGVSGAVLCAFAAGETYNVLNAQEDQEQKKKIVILGSGWGAVSFLKHLKPGLFDVKVVSPSNYFLFTPFLPSVTVGTIEGRSIVEPIRKIINKQHKAAAVEFYEAECISVDTQTKKVNCKDTSGSFNVNSYYCMEDILLSQNCHTIRTKELICMRVCVFSNFNTVLLQFMLNFTLTQYKYITVKTI